jgi:hypothetical protein
MVGCMTTDLFTPIPDPKPAKKRSFDEVWEDYRVKRDKVISEQFYGGLPIPGTPTYLNN